MKCSVKTLQSLAGEGGLLTGEDVRARATGIWNPDPIEADAIVRPRDTETVSRVLALCHEHRQPVVTLGGLTGLVDGALTRAGDLGLSTERMNRIEDLDRAGRTLVVQAGVTLQAVQAAAAEAGLEFALDLGARGSCTLGGNLATNAGGNRVIRYGMAREQVLGLEVVLADGTVLSSMNHMLKNNAGLDLKQLFVGSEGILGVITRAVLRLRERPRSRSTALLACRRLADVQGLLKHADGRLGGTLSAFEVMWRGFYQLVTAPRTGARAPLDRNHAYYVLLEARGGDAERDAEQFESVMGEALEQGLAVDAVVATSGRECETLWALRDDVDQTYNDGPPITFDISLRIADMEAYVDSVRRNIDAAFPVNQTWIFGHLGDGNLHIVVSVGEDSPGTRHRLEEAVYGPLKGFGGSVSAEHGIGLEKKAWLHLSRSEAEIDAMRRLKQALDPHGILNPGKML